MVRVLGGERVEHLDEPVQLTAFACDEQRLHGVAEPGPTRTDLLSDRAGFLAAARRFVDVTVDLRAHCPVERDVIRRAWQCAGERRRRHLLHRAIRVLEPATLEQVPDPPHLGLHREGPPQRAQLRVEAQAVVERLRARQRGVPHGHCDRDRVRVARPAREVERLGAELLGAFDFAGVVPRAGDSRGDERAECDLLLGQPNADVVEHRDEGAIRARQVEADGFVDATHEAEHGAGKADRVVAEGGEVDGLRVRRLRGLGLPRVVVRIAEVTQQCTPLDRAEGSGVAAGRRFAGALEVLHGLLGRTARGRVGSGPARVVDRPGPVAGWQCPARVVRDRGQRRVVRAQLLEGIGRGAVEPGPAGRGQAVVERVLDQRVGEGVVAVAVVGHDLGRDGLARGRRSRHRARA